MLAVDILLPLIKAFWKLWSQEAISHGQWAQKMSEEKATPIKRGISEHYSVNPGAFSNLVIWIMACADHPVVWAGDLSAKDQLYTPLVSS